MPLHYYCYVGFDYVRLLYIERRSFHLYHPRIVHLCNVKEVAPSKRLNSKALIYLFYLYLSWFHNKGGFIFLLFVVFLFLHSKCASGTTLLSLPCRFRYDWVSYFAKSNLGCVFPPCNSIYFFPIGSHFSGIGLSVTSLFAPWWKEQFSSKWLFLWNPKHLKVIPK